jgi:hypothetical protein
MPDDNLAWQQLSSAINLIGVQSQVAWTIFTVFLAGHAILAQAMFSATAIPETHMRDRHFAEYVVASFGSITAVIWFFFQRDSLARSKGLERAIARFEKSLGAGIGLNVSSFLRQGKLVSALMLIVPCLTGAAWLMGLYFVQVPPK